MSLNNIDATCEGELDSRVLDRDRIIEDLNLRLRELPNGE